jgi:hypothetical protein
LSSAAKVTQGIIRELLPDHRQDGANDNEGEGSDADGNEDKTKNPHKDGIERPPSLVHYGGTAGCHSEGIISQMKKLPSKIDVGRIKALPSVCRASAGRALANRLAAHESHGTTQGRIVFK